MTYDELDHHERSLCWIYGKQSKEFFHDRHWDEVEHKLREGWERIRRESRIEWAQARAHVLAAWES